MTISIDISYNSWVKPVQSNFERLELTKEEIELVEYTATKIADAKRIEKGYLVDSGSLTKRWTTGLGGEVVLGNYLNQQIMDQTVGPSTEYDIGDLKKIGLNIGVKSVEYGKFPLVHVNPVRPEIVLIKHPEKYKYMICGLYTPFIMKTYSSRDFVVDERVRDTKSAFYGIPFYKRFNNLNDLKNHTV
jgi:hypothetical protein